MRVVRKIRVNKRTKTLVSNQGWRTVAGRRIYFRSGWEVSYAWYLQFLKEKKQILEWEFEPQTFWFNAIKRGVRSYLPDFRVTKIDGSHYFVEVKGYMDAKSKTKLNRFKKYYPKEELRLVDGNWFKEMRQKLPIVTINWENQFTEGEEGNVVRS